MNNQQDATSYTARLEQELADQKNELADLRVRVAAQDELNRVILRARGLRVPIENGDVLHITVADGVNSEEVLPVIAYLREQGITAPILFTDGSVKTERLAPDQVREMIRVLEQMLPASPPPPFS